MISLYAKDNIHRKGLLAIFNISKKTGNKSPSYGKAKFPLKHDFIAYKRKYSQARFVGHFLISAESPALTWLHSKGPTSLKAGDKSPNYKKLTKI